MARPAMGRRIRKLPRTCLFKPADLPDKNLEEVSLTLDEFEALRLADYDGLYQEAAALRMEVSRQTFGRIIEAARRKMADALIHGKVIRVEGGTTIVKEKEETMKIAIPTKNGFVDDHFGHCAGYTVYTVDGNAITAETTLPSPAGCGCKSGVAGDLAKAGVGIMLAGNIGEGAIRVLGSFGIKVVRGVKGAVKEVAQNYLDGKISDSGVTCKEHHDHGSAGHVCAHS